MMSNIRGKNTTPERQVRKGLWKLGFRFRLHARLPGKPDIVLPKWNTVVFVHGCFWHAHAGCPFFRIPATRADFWRDKLLGNRARDERTIAQLVQAGLRVIVVWECALRTDAASAISLAAVGIRANAPILAVASCDGKVQISSPRMNPEE